VTPGGKQLVWHAGNEATIKKLRERRWDVVVLQDQSQTPAYFPKKFREGATALAEIAREQGERVVFYQTWGRRDGDKKNPKISPDYGTMQKMLSRNYGLVAEDLKCDVARVGDAWSIIEKNHPELFRRLYKGDGSHPSTPGAYLAATVIYQTIAGKLPDASFLPKNVSAEDAKLLLAAAAAVK
jgi:hypothetical protein